MVVSTHRVALHLAHLNKVAFPVTSQAVFEHFIIDFLTDAMADCSRGGFGYKSPKDDGKSEKWNEIKARLHVASLRNAA